MTRCRKIPGRGCGGLVLRPGLHATGLVRSTHCHIWPPSLVRPRALNLQQLQDTRSEPAVRGVILQQSSGTLLHSLASATTYSETCLSRHQRYYDQVATIAARKRNISLDCRTQLLLLGML